MKKLLLVVCSLLLSLDVLAQDCSWINENLENSSRVTQYNLGLVLAAGGCGPENQAEAINWYTKSAAQGFSPAQNALGDAYYKGTGVIQDYSRAIEWWRKAAGAKRRRLAQSWVHEVNASAIAQHNLGIMHESGIGVPEDYEKAIQWYRAASKFYSPAQESLGLLYYEGKGVKQNYKKAAKWFKKAANRGSASAQYNLGIMHYQGKGVPKDFIEAHVWFSIAAEREHKTAAEKRGVVESKMSRRAVSKAIKKAAWWEEQFKRRLRKHSVLHLNKQ